MLLKEPYITSELNQDKLSIKKNTLGHSILSDEDFRKFTLRDAKANLQISIHAQGDSAVDNTLVIYKNILQHNQNSDHRHRMEHLALIKESHIKEMAQLGITPSFHINHIHYYGDFLARIVGAERANQFMPIGLAEKYNMKFSLHNDSPMYPPKPFLAAQSAVTRKTLNGRPLGPSYAISIEEALRAITIYPAWQMFAEKEIGSLEVGKRADFIILDQNPLECNPEKIIDISILEVRVNGVQTFKKN